MPHKLHSYPSDTELARNAAADWLAELRARSNRERPYTVALSGGRVVKLFFQEIVKQSSSSPALFENVHFFWADERCVPPTDPESNYGIANQLLFEPLKISVLQIHRLHGEDVEHFALHDAITDIMRTASVAKGAPILDMIFLGMGEDGHVASLFPGEPDKAINDPAVYRAVTAVKPPPRRITLGYSTIAAALEVWVIASGAGKEASLKESLSPDGKTPLARVLRQRGQTNVYTDIKTS